MARDSSTNKEFARARRDEVALFMQRQGIFEERQTSWMALSAQWFLNSLAGLRRQTERLSEENAADTPLRTEAAERQASSASQPVNTARAATNETGLIEVNDLLPDKRIASAIAESPPANNDGEHANAQESATTWQGIGNATSAGLDDYLRRNSPTFNELRKPNWRNSSKKWTKRGLIVSLGFVVIGNATEPLLAMYRKDQHSIRDSQTPFSGVIINGSNQRAVFAANPAPGMPNRLHMSAADRATQEYRDLSYMTILQEDKNALAHPLSWGGVLHIHGVDYQGIGRALVQTIRGNTQGGSTLAMTGCSLYLNTTSSNVWLPRKVFNKLKEVGCAAIYSAEAGSDGGELARTALDNASFIIGGKDSAFGTAIEGVALAARAEFRVSIGELRSCQLAMLTKQLNLPLKVRGKTEASIAEADLRFNAVIQGARKVLIKFRKAQGTSLTAEDEACFRDQEVVRHRRIRNPHGELYRVFGPAGTQVSKEAFQVRLHQADPTVVTAAFDPVANQAAMSAVAKAACDIQSRRALQKNICGDSGPINGAQIRVHAMTLDGRIMTSVALGVGASTSLMEKNDGSLPPRGSIFKALLLAALDDGQFCRYNYAWLDDADGVQGYDHPCSVTEMMTAQEATKHSLNQPFLWAAEHSDQQRLTQLAKALALPSAGNWGDIVLGKRPAATQYTMRDFVAVTQPSRTARIPHFIAGNYAEQLNIENLVTAQRVFEVRQILSAPTQPGGTLHAFANRMGAAGYTVAIGKSGTSEAGRTSERGKHLMAELKSPSGRTLIVFAEIASSDASALSGSGVLSSADMAEIVIAALKGEAA